MFEGVIAIVLVPLAAWLALRSRSESHLGRRRIDTRGPLIAISAVVGCVGGIYGIGGGSILAPMLIGFGRSPREVAPATLATTLVASIAGIATFVILSSQRGHVGRT